MAWQTPKTDWVGSDRYNTTDLNRWKNNLIVVRDLAKELFGDFTTVTLYDDKTRSSIPLASEINALETILDQINTHSYSLNLGVKKTYSPNGHTIDYNEVNRLENGTLRLYQILVSHKAMQRHLPYRLGSPRYTDVIRV